jgi:hypothetical protein
MGMRKLFKDSKGSSNVVRGIEGYVAVHDEFEGGELQ